MDLNFGPRINRRPVDEMFAGGRKWHKGRKLGNGQTMLLCAARNSSGCHATARLQADGTVTRIPNNEYHAEPLDPLLLRKTQLLSRLYIKRTHSFASSEAIYNDVIRDFPDLENVMTYPVIQSRMVGWRRFIRPPDQDSYYNIQRLTQNNEWREIVNHTDGNMHLSSFVATDGGRVLMFGDPGMVPSVPVADGYDLHIQFTSLMVPNVADTMATIIISLQYEKRAMSFAYGYVNRISTAVCDEVVQYIREELLNNCAPPTRIITNLDHRIYSRITMVFPLADLEFHLHSIAMMILNRANQDVDVTLHPHQIIISKLLAISLLPSDSIQAGFYMLQNSLEGQYAEVFTGTFTWYREEFIDKLPLQFFTCYRKEYLLNNIPLLLSRNILNKCIGANRDQRIRQCAQWKLYEALLGTTASSKQDLNTLLGDDERAKKNISMSPKTTSYVVSIGALRRLWAGIDNEAVTVARALSIGSNILNNFIQLMIHQEEYIVCPFQPSVPDVANNLNNRPAEIEVGRLNLLEVLDFHQHRAVVVDEELLQEPPQEQPQQQQEQQQEQQQQQPQLNIEVDEDHLLNCYRWKCQYCNEQKINMIARPCQCVCICQGCSDQLINDDNIACPSCHGRVTSFDMVFMDDSDNPGFPIDWACKVCYINPKTHVLQTCKHMMCETCVEQVRGEERIIRCPFCRNTGQTVRANFIPL